MPREPITAEQRRALFAVGARLGFSADELRELAPLATGRRISRMDRRTAREWLDDLNRRANGEAPAARAPGRCTAAQRGMIAGLARDCGYDAARLAALIERTLHAMIAVPNLTLDQASALLTALGRIRRGQVRAEREENRPA